MFILINKPQERKGIVLVSNISYVETDQGGTGAKIFLTKEIKTYNWIETTDSVEEIFEKINTALNKG